MSKFFLSENDKQILARIIERERKGDGYKGGTFGFGDMVNPGPVNAKSKETIAADAVGEVDLCTVDWTVIPNRVVRAHNPSNVEVPATGVRLILQPGRGKDHSYQIQSAFLCDLPE